MTKRIDSLEAYQQTYQHSVAQPEAFWAAQAQTFQWHRHWSQVVDWEFETPRVRWFEGGRLNITENCLDRHLEMRGDQIALIWEPNEPTEMAVEYTYKELHRAVCQVANVFKKLGVVKGDRICFYMPMVAELVIGMLACARIGAVHSVLFAGLSANALRDRIEDAQAKLILTADVNCRGEKNIPVKAVVDEALAEGGDSVEKVLVYKRSARETPMQAERDFWWHEELIGASSDCPATVLEAEDFLFMLYTSGSTGKPKGVVHSCGGYMVYTAYSFQNVFQYQDGDVYWCTADAGWIPGHSYLVYGPLLTGATTLMFEGTPTYPDASRFWQICEKHRVNQFYTAPTTIRALQAYGDAYVTGSDLSRLKVIGTVGEPINEEAWYWYHEVVGEERCPVVDTWWQTETGGIMLSALGAYSPPKACFAGWPLPGVQPCLLNAAGEEIRESGVEGLLCIKYPWPSMIRTIYGNHERCQQVYFKPFKGYYFTGDAAKRDAEGRYRILGRVDDAIQVSGHRLNTAEIEDAINSHLHVVESAVVGYPHASNEQEIFAYIVPTKEITNPAEFEQEIAYIVHKNIGSIACPDQIKLLPDLPKTRSGKIMRRILRKIATGDTQDLGDTSTLLNPEVVHKLLKDLL
jgi:acetyl-CoA synthetase